MSDDAASELVDQLNHLLGQAVVPDDPVLPRIATAIAAGTYLDALTRHLVSEARERGHTWEELADVFVTSPAAVRNRFDTYRRYDDEG